MHLTDTGKEFFRQNIFPFDFRSAVFPKTMKTVWVRAWRMPLLESVCSRRQARERGAAPTEQVLRGGGFTRPSTLILTLHYGGKVTLPMAQSQSVAVPGSTVHLGKGVR